MSEVDINRLQIGEHEVRHDAEQITSCILDACKVNIVDVQTRDIVFHLVCSAIQNGVSREAHLVGNLINKGGAPWQLLGDSIKARSKLLVNRSC